MVSKTYQPQKTPGPKTESSQASSSPDQGSELDPGGDLSFQGGMGNQALIHLLRSGSGAPPDGLSDPASGAEVEASEVARRVGAGLDAGPVAAAPDVGIHRVQDYTDSRGRDVTHNAPTLDQAANARSEDSSSLNAKVEVLHDAADPLHTTGEAVPQESELWQEAETGTQVTAKAGSVASPNRTGSLADEPLFIDGTPRPGDVQQGGIGDCYFMAALIEMASSDPGKIVSMMSLSGDNVSVQFYYWDPASSAYVPESVGVNTELATYEHQGVDVLKGARFRLDEQPDEADWSAGITGSSLEITQDAQYQAAMWVPLLEKAYADFAERHGQYGGQPVTGGIGAGVSPLGTGSSNTSGYQIIDGGWEQMVYGMFYGEQTERTDIVWTADNIGDGSSLAGFEPTIRTLLMLEGKGLEEGQTAFLTASGHTGHLIPRLDTVAEQLIAWDYTSSTEATGGAVGSVLGGLAGGELGSIVGGALGGLTGRTLEDQEDQDFRAQVDQLEARVAALRTAIATWQGAQTSTNKEAVRALAEDITLPDAYPALWSSQRPHVYESFLELGLMVAKLGSDNSRGQRHLYGHHAYAVISASFVDQAGGALDLDPSSLGPDVVSNISPQLSTVLLRNPHHRNEPEMEGNGPDDGSANDGEFTLNMEQFVRAFDALATGVVNQDEEPEGEMGDFPMPPEDVAYA